MPLHREGHSIARDMTGSGMEHSRRHSASDILPKVLQRRRRSALEILSSSSHGVMMAVSMNQPATERKIRRSDATVPTAKYTKVGETLRHVIPGHMQCSMACGGRACKYENPSRWSDEEKAIKGLYSSWITDNLLAMARPSTEIIEKYNIIEQFQRCSLKTVINLQRTGEHASCGNPLEQESGFTYRPETFMEADIYYYNFGWKDYGVASLTTILDMVKVMCFAVQEGKLAIHCHAGLGRTGVLLACFIVFTSRMSADQAILFVRAKRPNSIQTRGQLLCVREFAQFLVPLRSIFSCAEPKASPITLSKYLTRQRHLLHGYEARQMRNVPKIVQLVCKLLVDIVANRQVLIEEEWIEIPDLTAEVEKTVSQQALQQLGKEMRGKGIPVPSCSAHTLSPIPLQFRFHHDQPLASDNELDPLWRQQNAERALRCSLYNSKSLSYSDSVLHKFRLQERHLENLKNKPHKHCFSHSSLTICNPPRFCDLPTQDLICTQELDSDANENRGSTCTKRQLYKGHQSVCLDPSEQGRKSNCNTPVPALSTRRKLVSSEEPVDVGISERVNVTEFPFITPQSELTPESRRLLVAKALATDLTDKDVSYKVSLWQSELNTREGAWERLCMERDPLVLSSLMWSWLAQLKDPVISTEDIKALRENNANPKNALDSLEKGHRLTLLCILDCAAHLLPIPEEVESSFLSLTIKVFTKIDPASENNLCSILKGILTPVFHELCDKVVQESDKS